MFVRESTSRRKDGTAVTYVQILESVWDPEKGRSVHRVLGSLGRKDELDVEKIRRFVHSLGRYLPEAPAADHVLEGVEILDSRPIGAAHLLEGLWDRFGLRDFFRAAATRRRRLPRQERALLAMLLNRAIDPRSKYGTFQWLRQGHVCFPDAAAIELQDLYRALDLLPKVQARLDERMWSRSCDLFGSKVDLVFYDTTTTYFEAREPDALRRRGKSKDGRSDAPQIVVGVAVNDDALPLRHWVHPGNTADVTTVLGAVDDLRGLGLGQVVFVGDRAMGGRKNVVGLKKRKIPYVIGCKLRGSVHARRLIEQADLQRKVLDVDDVREVTLDGERFVVSYRTDIAERDRKVRERVIETIRQDLESPKGVKKALAHPIKKRYLATHDGRVAIDPEKVRADEHLDGRSILLLGAPELDAQAAAQVYRSRNRVESAIRHMKSFVDLRPVGHRTDPRVRAHISLCVLTYFLERLVELRTQTSWSRVRDQLQRLCAVTFERDGVRATQVQQPSPIQLMPFRELGVAPPPRVLAMHAAPPAST